MKAKQKLGGGDSKEASTTAEILDFLVVPDGTQTIWQPGNMVFLNSYIFMIDTHIVPIS